MLTFKPERSQGDGLGDEYSANSAIDTGPEHPTRDEMSRETEISYIAERFGLMNHNEPQFLGEIDYTLDLQNALNAIQQTRDMFRRLPKAAQEEFGNWRNLLAEIEKGNVEIEDLAKQAATEQNTPPAPTPATTNGGTNGNPQNPSP